MINDSHSRFWQGIGDVAAGQGGCETGTQLATATRAVVLLARHRSGSGEQEHAELLASTEREIQTALRIAGAGNQLNPDIDVHQRHISAKLSVLLDSAPGLRVNDGGGFSE